MGWKQVKGHSYYYESVRVGKRVRSRYVGGGEFGALMDAANRLIRSERERRRLAWRAERAAVEAADAPMIQWCRDVEALARLTLEAGGFYRHDRGAWRRRGTTVKTTEAKVGPKPARKARAEGDRPTDPSAPPLPGPDIPLPELLRRARAGDLDVRDRLRALMQRGLDRGYPDGTMGPMLELVLAMRWSKNDILRQEVMIRDIRKTAEDLAGPDPSPLERILAHRISICLHVVHQVEWRREVEIGFSLESGDGIGQDRVEYHDRRVDGAQRRLMQAVKMLATVRRLAGPGPSVSVKVRQTVNVEAPEARPEGRGLSVPELMAAAPRG